MMINKNKLHMILAIITSCYYTGIYSQTYVGAFISIDYSKVVEEENSTGFRIIESGFKNKSIAIGTQLEQQISNSFYFTLLSGLTKKSVSATDGGFVPFSKIEYIKINSAFIFNWIPSSKMNSLSIGTGMGYSYIPNINKVRRDKSKEEIFNNRKEIGAIFSLGYLHKHFLFKFNYYQGVKIVGKYEKKNRLKPINSFEFSLGYMLKVFDPKKRKKVNCPRI